MLQETSVQFLRFLVAWDDRICSVGYRGSVVINDVALAEMNLMDNIPQSISFALWEHRGSTRYY